MNVLGVSLLALCLPLAPPAAGVAGARDRIFVSPLASVRVDPALAGVLTELLVHELSACEDCDVLSAGGLQALARKAALDQSVGCVDTRCQVDLARGVAAPFLVHGSVARVESLYLITLELMDVAQVAVIRRVQARVKGTESDLVALMEAAAPRLLTGEGHLQGEVPEAQQGERAAAMAEFLNVAEAYEQGALEYLDERSLVSKLKERLATAKKGGAKGRVKLKKVKAAVRTPRP